jgi:hypothetical protein
MRTLLSLMKIQTKLIALVAVAAIAAGVAFGVLQRSDGIDSAKPFNR